MGFFPMHKNDTWNPEISFSHCQEPLSNMVKQLTLCCSNACLMDVLSHTAVSMAIWDWSHDLSPWISESRSCSNVTSGEWFWFISVINRCHFTSFYITPCYFKFNKPNLQRAKTKWILKWKANIKGTCRIFLGVCWF